MIPSVQYNMDREGLKSLRPELFIVNSADSSETERFQNDTLRPIIKFQHDVILRLINSHSLFESTIRVKGPRQDFQLKIREFISSQPALKNQFIGLIAGMLTSSEFEFYLAHQNEVNKRIHSMICQRIADTLY